MEKTNAITNIANQSVLGWFYIVIILFMTAICVFAAFLIINTVSQEQVFIDEPKAIANINVTRSTLLSFDNVMLFIIVGISLFVIISSAMVFNHPAFFIISFLLLIISLVFAAIMSNTFWVFSTETQIESIRALYPKTVFIMERIPFYILFLGIAASIAAYVGYTRQ